MRIKLFTRGASRAIDAATTAIVEYSSVHLSKQLRKIKKFWPPQPATTTNFGCIASFPESKLQNDYYSAANAAKQLPPSHGVEHCYSQFTVAARTRFARTTDADCDCGGAGFVVDDFHYQLLSIRATATESQLMTVVAYSNQLQQLRRTATAATAPVTVVKVGVAGEVVALNQTANPFTTAKSTIAAGFRHCSL